MEEGNGQQEWVSFLDESLPSLDRLVVLLHASFAMVSSLRRVFVCIISWSVGGCEWYGSSLVLVQPHSRVGFDEVEVDFVAE